MRLSAVSADTRAMSARHATLLAVLAAVWGGSYLLIKYALEGFSAAAIVSLRCLLASRGAVRRAALARARRADDAPTCASGRGGR